MSKFEKIITISDAHYETEEGNMYQAGYMDLAVANNSSLEFLVRVGSTFAQHTVFSVNVTGESLAYIFEGPTITTPGTSITAVNSNRNSLNTAEGLFYHTPTTSADGTQLGQSVVPGGTGGQAVGGSGSSSIRDGGEMILKTNTDYLVRITNVAGNNKTISLTQAFYEEVPH